MKPPRIRRARPDDLSRLLQLEAASFQGDRLSRRQMQHHLQSSSADLLVSEIGPALLGYGLNFYRCNSGWARLYSIAVAAEARGQGIGLKLLRAMEAAARERACTGLRLEVRRDNQAAIALYESQGYKRIGIIAGYYEDGMDAWRYTKRWP